jgi:outer membrane immunogenic protein
MKKLMFAGAWFLAIGGLSKAADMPIKAPPAIVPIYTWTGLYLGLNAGGGEAKSGWCTNATVGTNGCADGDIVSQSHSSFTFGGQLGYRYQWGNLVLGAEGALNLFSNTVTSPAALQFFPNRVRRTGFDDLYSMTGQLGYALGNLLFYGKGGWAGAGMRYDANNINPGGFNLTAQTNTTGYTVGGGVDYLITPTFVIGIEYDYYKFNVGAFNGLVNSGGVVIACGFCNITESVQTVVARASLKF